MSPELVSIPFIAGQWSLPHGMTLRPRRCSRLNPLHCGAVVASESPPPHGGGARRSLNPLHCGAVVASSARGVGPQPGRRWSQSPSLRGSGRFALPALRKYGVFGVVSIPFIAGQWSLRLGHLPGGARCSSSQSPSLRGSGRFGVPPAHRRSHRACLNPLHCGAVVASTRRMAGSGGARRVSIPFIAGQWSLPKEEAKQ